MRRIAAFVDHTILKMQLTQDIRSVQSLYAIGSAASWAKGLPRDSKSYFICRTLIRFIFSVVGEELGLAGTLAVVIAFAFCFGAVQGHHWRLRTVLGCCSGSSIITGITVQALNISVVTSASGKRHSVAIYLLRRLICSNDACRCRDFVEYL